MKQYLNFNNPRISNYSLGHHFVSAYKKIEIFFYIILSFVFLITSKINQDFTNKISYFFVDISLPVVNLVALPFNLAIDFTVNFKELATARQENKLLKQQNQEMKNALIASVEISNENKELKEILKFVVPKALNYKAARVIGRTDQIFKHQLFLESRDDLVLKNGSAVVNEVGLIGRVVDASGNKARLLLPTDPESNIPIIISGSRVRGILKGDGSELMEVIFMPKDHREVQIGELVFTSADGETLPAGLLIGVVEKVNDNNVYVKMVQDVVGADIVSVLEY